MIRYWYLVRLGSTLWAPGLDSESLVSNVDRFVVVILSVCVCVCVCVCIYICVCVCVYMFLVKRDPKVQCSLDLQLTCDRIPLTTGKTNYFFIHIFIIK